MKKFASLLAFVAVLSPYFNQAEAACCNNPYPYTPGLYCDPTGGCGYEECRQATCLPPAVALSTVALAAIIAVIAQNRSGHGHHHHDH